MVETSEERFSGKMMTSKEAFEIFDRQLRISKSGISIKCGDRIVAKCPIPPGHLGGKDFRQWMEDAEKLCDLWNSESSAKDARITELEAVIRAIYPYVAPRTDKFLVEWKTRAYHALNSQLEKPDET